MKYACLTLLFFSLFSCSVVKNEYEVGDIIKETDVRRAYRVFFSEKYTYLTLLALQNNSRDSYFYYLLICDKKKVIKYAYKSIGYPYVSLTNNDTLKIAYVRDAPDLSKFPNDIYVIYNDFFDKKTQVEWETNNVHVKDVKIFDDIISLSVDSCLENKFHKDSIVVLSLNSLYEDGIPLNTLNTCEVPESQDLERYDGKIRETLFYVSDSIKKIYKDYIWNKVEQESQKEHVDS